MTVKHLNQLELARRWAVSPRTLERWRWLKQGPTYLKIGNRIVYRLEDIERAIRAVEPDQDADLVVRVATEQVQVITRRYADLIQWDLAEYVQWIQETLDIGDLFAAGRAPGGPEVHHHHFPSQRF